MIYDTLNNLPNYLGLCSSLDSVIEFIMARDINNLPAGRTRIDGDKAVVMVSTVTPQASDKASFVRHDNHLTLETDLAYSKNKKGLHPTIQNRFASAYSTNKK